MKIPQAKITKSAVFVPISGDRDLFHFRSRQRPCLGPEPSLTV